ncbi:MAG: D-hexose-6-phosphate mutarotase [Campylobacterota bacterium]
MQTSKDLKKFQIADTLYFNTDDNGLTKIIIKNDHSNAEIYLYGGHLTHFQPKGEAALIFDAEKSRVTPPKSVHAGIPICWPWFGVHPTDGTKPQHGFARDKAWTLKSTKALDTKETEVVLTLKDDTHTQTLFPFSFELELTFTIGQTLSIALKTTNTDENSFIITQALHTYFAVSDIDTVSITGVERTPFIDYTDNKKQKHEEAALQICQEVNRVYIPTISKCVIVDKGLKREIIIEKEGSDSTTIWNPWQKSGIHDLPEEKYREFVCIETTNALQDAIFLHPETSHIIVQRISVKKL